MTPPNKTFNNNGKVPKDMAPNDTAPEETPSEGTAPEGAGPEDTAPQNQPTSSATSWRNRFFSLPPEMRVMVYYGLQREGRTQATAPNNQPNVSATSTRNWLLYLPPEIRFIIYSYVLELPDGTQYWLPMVHPTARSFSGILDASRLIRIEAVDAFYRANTFHIWAFPSGSLHLFPTRRISEMIQNVTIDTRLWAPHQTPRQLFIGTLQHFGDPAIPRRRFTVNFLRRTDFRRRHLNYFLRALGRFTNFRTLAVFINFYLSPAQSVASLYDHVQNRLRLVLGPVRSRAPEDGLTFCPRRFLNAQPPPENTDWVDRLEGIRLEEVEEETNADESESSAQNPGSQG